MRTVGSILVRSPDSIGDQILAYPFFHYLREIYPSARITVICAPWVQSVQFRNLVDDVLTLVWPRSASFFDRWDAIEKSARMLRQAGPWDLGVLLPHSFSSALLFFRAGVKVRRGYAGDLRGILLNSALPWDPNLKIHRAESYVRLLKGLGPTGEESYLNRPIFEFWGTSIRGRTQELDLDIPRVVSRFEIERAWSNVETLDPPSGPYWVLAPGSRAESRRWPLERFASFAKEVAGEKGWKGIIVGGAGEMEMAQRLTADPSLNLMDWTGRGSPASFSALFRKAMFTLCNDSAYAHVAALCGSPVEVIWGAGGVSESQPLGPGRVQIRLNPVECWPCRKNQCIQVPERKLECLKGIPADDVWSEVKVGFGFAEDNG